jgi:hypothetical protein
MEFRPSILPFYHQNSEEERKYLIFTFYIEQRESLEEENRQVHITNSATIARLQELETTSSQLQVNLILFFFNASQIILFRV